MLFDGIKPYYCTSESILVLYSEKKFPRGFVTDPNYHSEANLGNTISNAVLVAVFEGLFGVENFNLVSPTQRNRFLLTVGCSPFQYNDALCSSRIFQEAHARHSQVLLLNHLFRQLRDVFDALRGDFDAIL